MAIIFDHRDESEEIYTAKFLSSANRHGIAIRYETDRAVLDLGLHLTAPLDPRSKSVTLVEYRVNDVEDPSDGMTERIGVFYLTPLGSGVLKNPTREET